MQVRGIALPTYDALGAPNALPILALPGALIEGLGPYQVGSHPEFCGTTRSEPRRDCCDRPRANRTTSPAQQQEKDPLMDTKRQPATPANNTNSQKPGTGPSSSKIGPSNGEAASPPQIPAAKPLADVSAKTEKPMDKVCWKSEDGQVVIRQKVRTAGRAPAHCYPVIATEYYPIDHSRIRKLPQGGLEVMHTHEEFEQLLAAINAADEKVKYGVTCHVPPKSKSRKEKWKRWNEARVSAWRRH
jgi:hypothetical protein